MRTNYKPPATAACLTCRAAKIRCDGRQPCSRCTSRDLTCSYRPSQRGGIRRRPKHALQYIVTPLPSAQTDSVLQAGYSLQQRPSIPDQSISSSGQTSETQSIESVINLLTPFHGIQNLGVPRHLSPVSPWTQASDPSNDRAVSTYIRSYASDEEIVKGYYIYIHSFLPLLTSPENNYLHDKPITINLQQSTDGFPDRSSLPHWPKSSFTLAISAILTLIPLPTEKQPFAESIVLSRRKLAQLYAEAAFDEVENELDRTSTANCHPSDSFGEKIDSTTSSRLYPILALTLLSVYEYCQRGNISRMRSRANQAVTAAMDLSLHNLGHTATEAERRAWWSAMLVLYLSSIDHQTPPVISLADERITTPFPSFQESSEPQPWPLLLESEESIISVSSTLNDCLVNPPNNALPSDLSENIMQLDSHLSMLLKRSAPPPQPTSKTGPDAMAARSMRLISSLLIHSARIRLHRARAFMDIPMFLEKHCDLSAIEDQRRATLVFDPVQSECLHTDFPFSEQESSLICLKSSLAIARALENLSLTDMHWDKFQFPRAENTATGCNPAPCLLPYFVCGAMQSSYVLLMSYYRMRAALLSDAIVPHYYMLSHPENGSEVEDVERLMRELRQGLESILGAMKVARMFEGVGGMSQEIHVAYQSAFMSDSWPANRRN